MTTADVFTYTVSSALAFWALIVPFLIVVAFLAVGAFRGAK